MDTFAHIKHKLNRDGFSQLDRENKLLSPSSIQIDGRETKDVLHFLYQYARQINYYDKDSLKRSGDWIPFFRSSVPFQYAVIASYDIDALEERFLKIEKAINNRLTFESLHLLYDLIFDMTDQLVRWFDDLQEDTSGLKKAIENLIETNLSEQYLKLLKMANSQGKWGYKRKKDGQSAKDHWQISNFLDLYRVDKTILALKGSQKGKVLTIYGRLEEIYRTFWKSMQTVIAEASDPDQLEKSINIDSQDHQPHIGLLFAFLKLFKEAQGGLNELSDDHLNFFYRKTLSLKEQNILPDQAHLSFELAKKVKEDILIEKGTRFKAGKDNNGKDIFFQLDDELIVNQTKVADLRTLFIDRIDSNLGYQEDIQTVKGIYMAPVAKSADGKGEQDFAKDMEPRWRTVGAKESKWTDPDKAKTADHPFARLGFMLASKILFLKEGKRKISIKLTLEEILLNELTFNFLEAQVLRALEDTNPDSIVKITQANKPISEIYTVEFSRTEGITTLEEILPKYEGKILLSDVFTTQIDGGNTVLNIENALNVSLTNVLQSNLFHISLTTEKGWLQVDSSMISVNAVTNQNTIQFDIELPPDFPPVVQADPSLLETDYGYSSPMTKFELNQEAHGAAYWYSLFRQKNICNITIDVDVCDVRQLVIQNDFALLDINKPFLPFGPLPKKDSSNFYLGNEEIFCKRWKSVEINPVWKDLPRDLNGNIDFPGYYAGYPIQPTNDSFVTDIEVLSQKEWITAPDPDVKLFAPDQTASILCPTNPAENGVFWKVDKSNQMEICDDLSDIQNGYLADAPCGFIKFRLGNQDFQHDKYANTLINSMGSVNFDKVPDLQLAVSNLITHTTNAVTEVNTAKSLADDLEAIEIPGLDTKIGELNSNIALLKTLANETLTAVHSLTCNPSSTVPVNYSTTDSKSHQTVNLAIQTVSKIGEVITLLAAIDSNFVVPLKTSMAAAKNHTDNAKTEAVTIDSLMSQIFVDVKTLPNTPYTPLIESINVNYSAGTNSNDYPDEVGFTHLHPYQGTYEQLAIKKDESCVASVLPCFVDEGTLYVGLEDYKAGSNLNLYFEMEPASADPDMDKAIVCWDYLRNNSWINLEVDTHVLSDSTNGLIQSGIVNFTIPGSISSENTTIMPPGLHWIKARILLRTAAISETFEIQTQSAKATFVPETENDLSRLDTPLEKMNIAKFESPKAGIKGVQQSYPSFGGRQKEASPHFYHRISEHLRHKGRAISIYDYERIILQEFKEIYKVKCISHTLGRKGQDWDFELAPGFVTIVVIPDLSKVNAVNPIQPKVPAAILNAVKDMLKARISPFINIEVLNPVFETISVTADVKFKKGKSNTFYADQLAEDVKTFLAPWAVSDTRQDISFGGNIYYSSILKFIEDRNYVDFLAEIKMQDKAGNFTEVIQASNSRVVLTSGKHKFTPIESDYQFVMSNIPDKNGIGYDKIPKSLTLKS